MKRVTPTSTKPYDATKVAPQKDWIISDLVVKILQNLYYTDAVSFSWSCKQAHCIITEERFWFNLANDAFSSNEASEKLNPKRKFKIYSNMLQARYFQTSVVFENCPSIGSRDVCQNRLVTVKNPGGISSLDFLDLKELKKVGEYYFPECEVIGCQDKFIFGFESGEIIVTSDPLNFVAEKLYCCEGFTHLAWDSVSEIVVAVDKKGEIFVWKTKEEPAPSRFFSSPVEEIDDLSVGPDVIVVRERENVFLLHHMSEKPVSKIELPDVSRVAVYQDQLVTSHEVVVESDKESDEKRTYPAVKIWDVKTLELKETINLAQLAWIVNPFRGMDNNWTSCQWTQPCMEGVFVSQVIRENVGPFIVIWNLKTKTGSVLEDVDLESSERNFLIHDGKFITTDGENSNILNLFDFS